MIELDPQTTALVLIDLQNGIMGRPLAPLSGAVLSARGKALAERFRVSKATVILFKVAFSADFADALSQRVDEPSPMPPGGFPQGFTDLVPDLAQSGDIVVIKRQWGAFHGTDLDLQLRRRGISTIVLGGVATQIGVESTARQAYEHGYALVLASDVTTSTAQEPHDMSMRYIMPRIARIADSQDIAFV